MLSLALAFLALTAADAPVKRDAAGFPAPDRPVAEIVSPIWASEEERDSVGETRQVFELMRFRKGQAIADIGAGSGYYTVRLSPVVGSQGRVYAQDIMPNYLAGLKKRVDELKLANITLVQGTPDDPKLAENSLDGALLIHMYHEIEQPYGLMWRLAGSMKKGGRVGIVDSNRRPENHGTPPALLLCEMRAVGYRQVLFRTLEGGVGYLAIFEPPAPQKRPKPEDIKPCKG